MASRLRIAIAGAGIGGLTAALCLKARGFEPTVFEATPELRPLGVGINILPHGSGVLHGLGLGQDLEDIGVRTRALEYRTRFGHIIQSDARGVDAGYAFPQFSVHRGELQVLLLGSVRERIGPSTVMAGKRIESFAQDKDEVRLGFADGSEQVCDLLIGADGFRSRIRRLLHPDEGPAHYEGTMLWRGAHRQAPHGDGRTMFVAGDHEVKFVCYPISGRAAREGMALVNWVAEIRQDQPRAAEEADWSKLGGREFIARFEGFAMPDIDIGALMRNTEVVTTYPMIDRDPLPSWTQGRVTLLGDAAHPMYPIGSNGASQAILDAQALAEALAVDTGPGGLAAYEAVRRPATTNVVLSNRQWGPEQVLDIAAARVKSAADRIEDLISPEEIEQIAARYRAVAGFGKSTDAARTSP